MRTVDSRGRVVLAVARCVAESMTPGRDALRHLVSRCNGGADAGACASVSKRGVCCGYAMVDRERFRVKAWSSMLSQMESTPPPQSRTELVLPGACGCTSHFSAQAPSLGTVEARGSNTALLPRPHPRSVPFLLSAGFPCDTPKLSSGHRPSGLWTFVWNAATAPVGATVSHSSFPRPIDTPPSGTKKSWAEKGPWPRNCIWYHQPTTTCPRLDLAPGNPGIASAVFSYSNREGTP